MSRQEGDPVPHEHEFYRAHLQGLFSLDLTSAGTFYDSERVGYKNLDAHRRDEAKKRECKEVMARKQKAWRLPLEERSRRVSTLIRGLGELSGGAKQALHYTDLTPAVVFVSVTRNGNHPFYRILRASKTHKTEFHQEALEEILRVYESDFLSSIYVGWAKGFLDEERERLEQFLGTTATGRKTVLCHPREAIQKMVGELADPKNSGWYE